MTLRTLLLATALLLPHHAMAQNTPGEIVVTGVGQATAPADVGIIRIEISHTEDASSTAMNKVTDGVTSVLATLGAYGVSDEDIETTRLSLSESWEYGDGAREFVGYSASSRLNIKVRDLTQIGDLIATLVKSGATGISGPDFIVEDTQALRDAARRDAVLDAVATAQLLAEAAGVAIGPPLLISDGTRATDELTLEDVMNEMEEPMEEPFIETFAEIAEEGAPVLPGTIERTETVKLIFRIDP